MKIKVTFEKIYDADEFFGGLSEEELNEITYDEFKDCILDEILYFSESIEPDLNFEEIK